MYDIIIMSPNKINQNKFRRNKTMATKKYTIQEMAKAYLDKDMAVIADIGRKHPLASYQLANMNIAGLEAIAVIPTKVMGKKLELGLKAMHNIGDVDLEDDGDEPAEEVDVEEESPKAKKERKSKKDKAKKSKKAKAEDDDEDEEVVEEADEDEDDEVEEKPAKKAKGKKAKAEKPAKSKKAAKKEADEDDDDDFDFED